MTDSALIFTVHLISVTSEERYSGETHDGSERCQRRSCSENTELLDVILKDKDANAYTRVEW